MKTYFLYCFVKKWFHILVYHFKLLCLDIWYQDSGSNNGHRGDRPRRYGVLAMLVYGICIIFVAYFGSAISTPHNNIYHIAVHKYFPHCLRNTFQSIVI